MTVLMEGLTRLRIRMRLRSRLLRVRLGRDARGGEPADHGLYLDPVDAPRPGIDYEPAELSTHTRARLDAIIDELLDANGPAGARPGRSRPAWRGRVAALSGAALLALAGAAGASELIAGTTGVTALDRLLGQSASTADRDSVRPSRAYALPKADGSHVVMAIPLAEGETASAYLDDAGQICSGVADAEGDVRTLNGTGTCTNAAALADELEKQPAVVGDVRAGTVTIVTGYAAPGVEAIRVSGPQGPLTVRLSAPWTPDVTGATPLRLFVAATGPTTSGDLQAGAVDKAIDPSNYDIVARLRDGSEIEIAP